MKGKDGLLVHGFGSAAAWSAWLEEHHQSSPGIWMRIAKKGAGTPSVSYTDALDVALAYGWIDSQKAPLDAAAYLQRFTPRKAASKWSKINCQRVLALIERDAMKPAGLRQVELAQGDGRWERAYDSHRTAEVPPDLQEQLDAHPRARAFFATLDSANRYAILYRVQEPKRAETRARRIAKFIAMLEAGETLH